MTNSSTTSATPAAARPASVVEKAITEQFQKHVDAVAVLNELHRYEPIADAIAARFPDLGTKKSIFGGWWDKAQLMVSVNVRTFRDLEPVIEFVEDWVTPETQLRADGSTDYTDLFQRDYLFRNARAGERSPVVFRLSAQLPIDGNGCRRVVVGTKEPEPIYEFRCEEPQV